MLFTSLDYVRTNAVENAGKIFPSWNPIFLAFHDFGRGMDFYDSLTG